MRGWRYLILLFITIACDREDLETYPLPSSTDTFYSLTMNSGDSSLLSIFERARLSLGPFSGEGQKPFEDSVLFSIKEGATEVYRSDYFQSKLFFKSPLVESQLYGVSFQDSETSANTAFYYPKKLDVYLMAVNRNNQGYFNNENLTKRLKLQLSNSDQQINKVFIELQIERFGGMLGFLTNNDIRIYKDSELIVPNEGKLRFESDLADKSVIELEVFLYEDDTLRLNRLSEDYYKFLNLQQDVINYGPNYQPPGTFQSSYSKVLGLLGWNQVTRVSN